MKIKKFKIVFILIFLFTLIPFSFSCKSSQKQESIVKNSLSEYRKNLFVGFGSTFTVTFTSGEREELYIMDGKKNTLQDFGVLTLKFNSLPANLPQFELKVNANTFVGTLEKNPYDNTFVYDICSQVEDIDTLALYIVDFDETVKLSCISSSWEYNYLSALNIFENKFKSEINSQIENNILNGEIYIKIVSDNEKMENIYWYVLLVCKNGDMYALLIDTKTGQIIQN